MPSGFVQWTLLSVALIVIIAWLLLKYVWPEGGDIDDEDP